MRCATLDDDEQNCSLSESFSQAANSHSLMQAATQRNLGVILQAPNSTLIADTIHGNKLAIEAVIVVLFILLIIGCFRMKGKFKDFFHHQSQDVAEIREARKEAGDEDPDDDWTLDQLISNSLGLQEQDPLLETSPFDPDIIPKFIDSHYTSFKLLCQIIVTLAQFWAALVYMYWALLSDDSELIDCEAIPVTSKNAGWIIHACHYTRTCLNGFPILAANMTLVVMVRTLLQQRLYYSMLRSGYLVVFQGVPILRTIWPMAIFLSMAQGALHFVMKNYYLPQQGTLIYVVRLMRKFVLPGGIFFLILAKYADVEHTLVPLNHIAELEVNEDQHHSPWLMRLKIMNERVLAFDVRHRDVFADVQSQSEKTPGLHDILHSVISHYEVSRTQWHARVHRQWGLFRSMWPAALLVDKRLDRTDRPTKQWMIACSTLLGGSVITCCLSVYLLLAYTKHFAWYSFFSAAKTLLSTGYDVKESAHVLVNITVLGHVTLLIFIVHHTITNMFFFQFSQEEIEHATHDDVKRQQSSVQQSASPSSAGAGDVAGGDRSDPQASK